MPTLAELGEVSKAAWWNQGRLAERAATRAGRVAERKKGVNVPWDRKQDRRGFFDVMHERRQRQMYGRPHPSVETATQHATANMGREAEKVTNRASRELTTRANAVTSNAVRQFGEQADRSSANAAERLKEAGEEVSRNSAGRALSVGQRLIGEATEQGRGLVEEASTTGARRAGANAAEGAEEAIRRRRGRIAGTAALTGGAAAGGAAIPAIGTYEYKRARERGGNNPKPPRTKRYSALKSPKKNVYQQSYGHSYGQGNSW